MSNYSSKKVSGISLLAVFTALFSIWFLAGCSEEEGCPVGQEEVDGVCTSACPAGTVRGADGNCSSDSNVNFPHCDVTDNCAFFGCNLGDVWCMDNCGHPTELEEECPTEICENGECSAGSDSNNPDNIVWQKQKKPLCDYGLQSLFWNEAVEFCEGLNFDGYDSWRLPTIDELRSQVVNCPNSERGGLCSISESGCHSTSCFKEDNCNGCDGGSSAYWDEESWSHTIPECNEDNSTLATAYWSSTEISNSDEAGSDGVWIIEFGTAKISWMTVNTGEITNDGKPGVRCVRDMTAEEIEQADGDAEDSEEDGDI